MIRKEALIPLDPNAHTDLSGGKILEWFRVLDAGWVYQGDPDPKKLHAELSSGKCSNGYFDCRKVLCWPNLCAILARQLANQVRVLRTYERPHVVVGSPYSGITFSFMVAMHLHLPHVFAEKDPADPKRMVFKDDLPASGPILQVEELVTTEGTANKVRDAILATHAQACILPPIATLVYRPAPGETRSREVISLLHHPVSAWEQSDCPYCAAGSLRVKPKKEWSRLVGRTS
ncbi:hypothetical protein KKG36_01720 [Patescibacteria group bacterium]|nr:hypothetical protein [Patescibacteria group bacterium]